MKFFIFVICCFYLLSCTKENKNKYERISALTATFDDKVYLMTYFAQKDTNNRSPLFIYQGDGYYAGDDFWHPRLKVNGENATILHLDKTYDFVDSNTKVIIYDKDELVKLINASDNDLIDQVCGGDNNALKELVKQLLKKE